MNSDGEGRPESSRPKSTSSAEPTDLPRPRPAARPDVEAAVRVNLENAIGSTCPHCGQAGDEAGLLLNMSFVPTGEGLQVIVVRSGAAMKTVTDQVRRTLLVDALRRARGNHAKAARLLDMKYSTFYALAKRLLGAEVLDASDPETAPRGR